MRLADAMKAKKLKQALQELAEEGVVQVFRPLDGSPAMVGVVGALQLDVLKVRLADEYGLDDRMGPKRIPTGALDQFDRQESTRQIAGRVAGRPSLKTSTATPCSWRAIRSISTIPPSVTKA